MGTNDTDWRSIICRGIESDELDYKAAQNWKNLSRAGKAKFVRHCIAMANIKGGYVVYFLQVAAVGNLMLNLRHLYHRFWNSEISGPQSEAGDNRCGCSSGVQQLPICARYKACFYRLLFIAHYFKTSDNTVLSRKVKRQNQFCNNPH